MISGDRVEALLEKYVKQNSVVSFGTGPTNEAFLKKLAIYVESSGLRIKVVPTSHAMGLTCAELRIPTVSLNDVEVDLAFDYIDQVDNDFNYISNETTSLIRDKMIAQDTAEMIVVAKEENFVPRLNCKMNIEASTFAVNKTMAQLMNLGEPTLKLAKGKPIMSETGHYFIELKFDEIYSLEDLDYEAKRIPGVLETSLFIGYADRVVLYGNDLTVKSRLTNVDDEEA
jgi:ribose 5-phosphate isomerase A